MTADYAGLLHVLRPETQLVVGAVLVLFFDMVWAKHRPANRHHVALALGTISLLMAGYEAATMGATGPVYGGAFMVDQLAIVTRTGVIGLALLSLALLPDAVRLRHPAEFTAILLFATTGFTLMAVANNLLLAFLALELASLSLYILAGFNKTDPASAEAALKYYLFGAMSAAFLLFGFSLLYGLTGSINLDLIATHLAVRGQPPLLIVALVMVLVAFGFKAAAAPFHLWAPDVYQGAPAPAAALIASASKLAGLVLFTRLLWPGLGGTAGTIAHLPLTVGWAPVVALLAGASLLLGNIGALAQSNVRRLLAYSAIAHAGVMLLGVIAAGRTGLGPLFYYAATYGLATVGAFGVIAALESGGRVQQLSDLAGLYRRSPFLAGCLAIFILSLAGIPPLAGFFGKFAVFASVLQLGGLQGPAGWLTILAIALSAVALYYYVLILKQALVATGAPEVAPVRAPLPARLALLVAASLIVLLGLMPSLLLGLF
ncbi:NADH-quinone oxidoreductase subunit N [Lacunisphaera limnophila]|uniref:NADH-quinone oxidoreductase subunit N n=1 Tax=Lacunisphaera limnophila TaxID=1838286 RepID=A0A1D8AV78_9BACT|nr:NADH-quinone oxidoreductase subunit N [Lacunisphaera limnophila]AOS44793.1 NADH-quinone oxidoreductase subunit N [Lacunisphaera limnophila]